MKEATVLGMALLVAGVIMLYFGWQSSESIGDQLTESLTGRFTNETMFFIIGGAAAIVVGLYLSIRGK
ncbi:MAG: DUF3185 family protein [Pseudohongiellaceae bacterium]